MTIMVMVVFIYALWAVMTYWLYHERVEENVSVRGDGMAVITLDPAHPDRIPTAKSDVQVQALIDAAVLAERARCIQIVRDEVARWDARNGVGWSWDKVRANILAAVNMVK